MNILSKKHQAGTGPLLGVGGDKLRRYDDIINLSIGDPDVKTPAIALQGAFDDLQQGNYTGYSNPQGYDELRQEIVDYYQAEYGVSISFDQVAVTTSGGYGMFLSLSAILDPGDEVILFEPYFTPYAGQIGLAGGVPVPVPTYQSEGFQIDMGRLQAAITPRTKAMLINTPSNPSGTVYTLETLQKLAQVAKEHNLVVLADDIYTAYSYGTPFVPIMSLEGMAERTITINSFSKNFVMTGLRIANIVAPKYVLDAIAAVNSVLVFSPPSYSQRAALHAMRGRKSFQADIVARFQNRIAYGVKRLQAMPGISILPPSGGFYLFPNIAATGMDCETFCNALFDHSHVLVTPGTVFGASCKDHIRICATVDIPVLEQAFDRIAGFLAQLPL